MKAAVLVGLLFAAFAVSTVFCHPDDVNKHVPPECFNGRGEIITDGPYCKKRFAFSTRKATWFEANQNCKAERRQLASIKNRHEQELLEAGIVEADLGSEHLWLGATDKREEGTFRWIGDGQRKMVYTNWYPYQPDHSGESCLEIGCRYRWFDNECGARRLYVCEYYGQPDNE